MPLVTIKDPGLLESDATSLAGTPIFGIFLPLLFPEPLKLYQVGWGALRHRHFHTSPEMFSQVQVWTLAGPLTKWS